MKKCHRHFSKVAPQYRELRTTDLEPILFIKKKLKNLTKINAADVGCGAGRYDIELFRCLGKRLFLNCIDDNDNMLKELARNLKASGIKNFKTIKAPAKILPLEANSQDVILTFNAIHHFRLLDFLKETSRVLRDNGYLFIYTRLRSQNKRNIWGKYFPGFYQKEKRLYELNELRGKFKKVSGLKLSPVKYFEYKRTAKLARLITQASNRHYSTFYLYNKKEFKKALKKFQESITRHFNNLNRITWYDENTMLVIKKPAGGS